MEPIKWTLLRILNGSKYFNHYVVILILSAYLHKSVIETVYCDIFINCHTCFVFYLKLPDLTSVQTSVDAVVAQNLTGVALTVSIYAISLEY